MKKQQRKATAAERLADQLGFNPAERALVIRTVRRAFKDGKRAAFLVFEKDTSNTRKALHAKYGVKQP